MEDVLLIEKKGDKIIAIDLFGDTKEFEGEIKKIDLNNNKILLVK